MIRGEGGKRRQPRQETDTLFSTSTAKVVDCICEGEVLGLAKQGLRGVYLDNTPVENPDGSYNFEGLLFQFRPGTQDQDPMPGFGDTVESETSVNIEVKASTPVTRTIVNPDVDAVRITVNVPQLVQYEDDGSVVGTSIQLRISISTNGSAYQERIVDTIEGKTTGGYQRQYYISLDPGGNWLIRVQRLTPDSTDDQLIDKFFWTSYAEVQEIKLRYPNSVVAGVAFDAEQFAAVPQRRYLLRGRMIDIPSNAFINGNGGLSEEDDGALVVFGGGSSRAVNIMTGYNGNWDGTFQRAWSSNPAWVLRDLLTNKRFGCGIEPQLIDKWSLYEIAKYCDEPVTSGFGYMEPRFACHCNIENQEDAFRVIEALSSTFRGMAYFANGAVTFVQDTEGGTVRIFNQANVIEGTFNYEGTAKRARHTVAFVRWINPQLLWEPDIEVVEDIPGINKYGYWENDVTAFACTSRGQAQRVGRWILTTEMLQTETISFRTGAEGVPVRPGEIIEIGDPNRTSGKRFGRLTGTNNGYALDRGIELASGGTFTVVADDGTLHTSPITNPGWQEIVQTEQYAPSYGRGTLWIYTPPDDFASLYRVIGASQVEPHIYEITAVIYNPAKFGTTDQVNFGSEQPPEQRSPNSIVNTPNFVTLNSYVVLREGQRFVNLSLGWQPPQHNGQNDPFITGYEVQYRTQSGSWMGSASTAGLSYDWMNLSGGSYYGRVRAVDFRGAKSSWIETGPVSSPLPPSITSFDPPQGTIGTAVTITGQHFVDVISVTFAGTPAGYTVNSLTTISTTVPVGATSGQICVRTAGGIACR